MNKTVEWDEIDHDEEFVEVQTRLIEFFKTKRKPLCTREIREQFGDKFLYDALQVLESAGHIASMGSLMLPRYKYAGAGVKKEKMRSCYHCGRMRPQETFRNTKTKTLEKICPDCLQFRKR